MQSNCCITGTVLGKQATIEVVAFANVYACTGQGSSPLFYVMQPVASLGVACHAVHYKIDVAASRETPASDPVQKRGALACSVGCLSRLQGRQIKLLQLLQAALSQPDRTNGFARIQVGDMSAHHDVTHTAATPAPPHSAS
jgi:hypothetical protein